MKLIIHDLDRDEFDALQIPMDETDIVYSKAGGISSCIGCFGCWVKTPGRCVIKDGYENIGRDLAHCHEVHIISRCVYGSYSPFVKNVLDRSISYVLPFFVTKNKEMHHQSRYSNTPKLTVQLYGSTITEDEKKTAEQIAQANSINMNMSLSSLQFYKDVTDIKEMVR